MRGRKPTGPDLADRLEGPDESKRRLKAILETISGNRTIADAAAEIGVGEARFHELRNEVLQAALAALEPRPAGRPARERTEADPRVVELESQIRELDLEVKASHVREQLALHMPHVLQRAADAIDAGEPLPGDIEAEKKKTAEQSHGQAPQGEKTPLRPWRCSCRPRRARGYEGQKDRREQERLVRVGAVQFALWAKRTYDVSRNEAARRLRISPATLKRWLDGFEENGLAAEPRGRPAVESDRELRLAVRALFDVLGPGLGVPTLKEFFGSMPRRELDDIARQYQKVHYDGKRVLVHALSWSRPGAVWAMDYTAPPAVIEDGFRTILVVRDLASGCTLLALPARADSAQTTVEALRALFVEHGAPLAIKSDNGGHFVAAEVAALLAEHGVVHLRSPYYCPTYNGAIEAGIGALKVRAHIQAALHDRPGEWTLDDVEAARLRGNELGRPLGARLGSPDRVWGARAPLEPELRGRLAALICQNKLEELGARGYQEGAPLGEEAKLSIGRAAIARALCQLGFVQYRRRRIPLPINPGLRSRIA